jgi:hypothetical protein
MNPRAYAQHQTRHAQNQRVRALRGLWQRGDQAQVNQHDEAEALISEGLEEFQNQYIFEELRDTAELPEFLEHSFALLRRASPGETPAATFAQFLKLIAPTLDCLESTCIEHNLSISLEHIQACRVVLTELRQQCGDSEALEWWNPTTALERVASDFTEVRAGAVTTLATMLALFVQFGAAPINPIIERLRLTLARATSPPRPPLIVLPAVQAVAPNAA